MRQDNGDKTEVVLTERSDVERRPKKGKRVTDGEDGAGGRFGGGEARSVGEGRKVEVELTAEMNGGLEGSQGISDL